MAPVKIYGDGLSGPVRAVWLFCKTNGIEYEQVLLEISQGDTKKPEWFQKNPLGKVPVLEDDGYVLSESQAILRYLALTRAADKEYLYPQKDVKKLCQTERILDWHHSNVRAGCGGYCLATTIGPAVFGLPVNDALAKECLPKLEASLQLLQDYFLAGEGPFLLGPQLTLADYSLATELAQTAVLSEETRAKLFDPVPKVKAWLEQVQKASGPHWEEVSGKLHQVAAKCEAWRQSQIPNAA